MSQVRRILLEDAEASLLQRIRLLAHTGNLEEVFAAWIIGDQICSELAPTMAVAQAAAHRGAARTYRNVAIVGLGAALGIAEPASQGFLEDGLTWLSGRQAFGAGVPVSFETDGVALFGIALGISRSRATVQQRAAHWILSFLQSSASISRLDEWDRVLMRAAAIVLNADISLPGPYTDGVVDLRVALRSRALETGGLPDEDEIAVLKMIMTESTRDLPSVRSAARLAALRWVRRSAPTLDLQRPTIQGVVRLLERIPAALKRWTWEDRPRTGQKGAQPVRWHVDHEYHVQNLLWIALVPVFPDLEDEENLPSVGHKHPRCDLGIPSLNLIVEAKFVRDGTQTEFTRIIEEVAADSSLYRTTTSVYKHLIAFLWDDSRSTEQHNELKQGLLRIEGVIGAVIVSRPGKMT